MVLKTQYEIREYLETSKVDGCKHRRRYAITPDRRKHAIQKDQDGNEFFYIDNPYAKSYRGKYFIGRITDAVKSVLEGYADAVECGSELNVFSMGTCPIIMINRELGEEYHRKSVDGWKDAKFGWCIRYGNKNSFGPGHIVEVDAGKKLTFTSEEEAEAYVDSIIEQSKKLYAEYCKTTNEQERKAFFDKLFESNFDHECLTEQMAYQMIEHKDAEKYTEDYYIDIEQCVLRR